MKKTKIVAVIWTLGILLFAGWMIVAFGGIVLGLIIRSLAYANLLAWLVVGGFALSGSIIAIGFVFKLAWKLSDKAIFEELPKIMQ